MGVRQQMVVSESGGLKDLSAINKLKVIENNSFKKKKRKAKRGWGKVKVNSYGDN